MLKDKDNNKKKDPITGAENKKKIPIFKDENPNKYRSSFLRYFKLCIKIILKLNSIFLLN